MRYATAALAAILLAVVSGPNRTDAAFPGSDGRIAFEYEAPAGNHTQTDIYTIQPNGRDTRQLTNTPNKNEFGVTWNASGTRLAFWRTKAPFGTGSVWVMDGDGKHARALTSGFDARDPAWNPAGTRIVFTGPGTGGAFFDLWTMNASDGSNRRRLTSGPALDFEAAWSPDGTRIAFTRGFSRGDAGDIYVLTLATHKLKRVTSSPEYDHQVAWSPDGSRLVFERDEIQSSSIYTVAADGTGLKRLTTGRYFDVGPAFSPDGERIAFGTDRGGGPLHDVWTMDTDGTNRRRLTSMPYAEGFPDWQPIAAS